MRNVKTGTIKMVKSIAQQSKSCVSAFDIALKQFEDLGKVINIKLQDIRTIRNAKTLELAQLNSAEIELNKESARGRILSKRLSEIVNVSEEDLYDEMTYVEPPPIEK